MPKQKTDPQEIIKIALEIFLEKGYHKTSMADIANETGLLKGSLYHHFNSKQDLMKAIIKSIHDWYRREIFSIQSDKSLTTDEKVRSLIAASEEIFFNQRGGNFMTNIALETMNVIPEFTMLIRSFFKDWVNVVESVFAEQMPAKTAANLARQAISDIEGAVVMMEIFDDKNYLRRTHKRVYNLYKQNSLIQH